MHSRFEFSNTTPVKNFLERNDHRMQSPNGKTLALNGDRCDKVGMYVQVRTATLDQTSHAIHLTNCPSGYNYA